MGVGGLGAGARQVLVHGARGSTAGNFLIVLVSLANAGRRHCWAQASQPISRRLAAARSRVWKIARSCSLQQVGAVERAVGGLDAGQDAALVGTE